MFWETEGQENGLWFVRAHKVFRPSGWGRVTFPSSKGIGFTIICLLTFA
jgi:hypothetical protein